MTNIQEMMVNILKTEVKPAMGCTEPVAIALAAAKAREINDGNIIELVSIDVCPNFFKNALSVGIPNCDLVGLDISTALGAAIGDASGGLNVLEKISIKDLTLAKSLVSEGKINLGIADTLERVLIDVRVKTETGITRAIIKERHDKFVYTGSAFKMYVDSVDKEKFYKVSEKEKSNEYDEFFNLKVRDIVKNIEDADVSEIQFLMDGLVMNEKIARIGLGEKLGMGTGFVLYNEMLAGNISKDLCNYAMCLTAGASDARMSGISLPVMSSNGSGNNGLTAILPLVAYKEMYNPTDDEITKALAISHLINCYIKNRIGRLSALCSCSVSAATGSSAAIAWLMTKDYSVIEDTITNIIGNVAGVICDGAKESCALKLSTAAASGVRAAILASNDCTVKNGTGIIGHSVENTIKNLGELSNRGMRITDTVILDVMLSSQK